MDETIKPKGKKSINYYMRALHRDIGFFVAGLIVVYALNGIILNYRDTNFLKTDTQVEKKLSPNMKPDKVGEALRLKGFEVTKTEGETIWFKEGTYNLTTGVAIYTTKDIRFPFNKLINLHKSISKNPAHWFNVLFGVLFLFMAISSFWMFKKGTKYFRRGIFIASTGIVFVIILLLI